MADLQSAVSSSSGKETAGFLLSTPSTKTPQKLKYDVFINHRGCDTKKSLASVLYTYLKKARKLHVFIDNMELEFGDDFPDELKWAIQSSCVHIAILSEKYAESSWCLAELDLMLQTDAKLVPVFYHVAPSVPRYCQEPYAKAFRDHESKKRYSEKQINQWRAALGKVATKNGWEWNEQNNNKGELLEEIVKTVIDEVHRRLPLYVAQHPVGLAEAVQDFHIKWNKKNNPRLVGIVGMAGSGKTTLAKELFNRKRSVFDASCFLSDVRKSSAMDNLPTLQKKLLQDLLHFPSEIDCINTGKGLIGSRLAKLPTTSKFLVILDDIHDIKQVHDLSVEDLLKTDSLIIITSCDNGLFKMLWPNAMLYDLNLMGEKHARELFCMHAFGQHFPKLGFEILVEDFLRVSDGLPLSLRVLGNYLLGKSKNEWGLALKKFSEKLHPDIKSQLQISNEALDTEEKEMFQDVACFFTGHPKNMAIKIWDASGWSGDMGFQTLQHRSLIEVHNGESVSTHGLLRNLGKDMAAADPKDSRRLWKPEERNFLEKDGFRKIFEMDYRFRTFLDHFPCSIERPQNLYAYLGFSNKNKDSSGSSAQPSSVDLFLGDDHLQPGIKRSSNDLLWLKWENCRQGRIPSWLPMKSLRHLEVVDGVLNKLWISQAPCQLRELVIQRNPLTSLPKEFECLTNLEHIDFQGCNRLVTLPKSFSSLTKLQYLDLSDCASLKIEPCHLSFGKKSQTQLRTLRLLGTTVNNEVLNEIGKLNSLECLTIGDDSLTDLSSVGNLKELTRLCIGRCKKMKNLPVSLWTLSLLTNLTITTSGVERLPERIGELSKLRTLMVEDCPITELTFTNSKRRKVSGHEEEIPSVNESTAAFNNLHSGSDIPLHMCMVSLENVTLQTTNVRKIAISGEFCPSLVTLILKENKYLVEVDLTLLSTVECLCLSGCNRLKTISGLSDLAELKELEISGCSELEELRSLQRLSALHRFTADKCWKLQNTGGVEQLEGLRDFRLLADNVAVWDCFRGLQRLPSHQMILGRRAGVGVKPINIRASDFPDGTAVNSFFENEIAYVIEADILNLWNSPCKTCLTMIICFVVECFCEDSLVKFWGSPVALGLEGAVRIRAGKWVIASIFVFKEDCAYRGDLLNLQKLQILLARSSNYSLKEALVAIVKKAGGQDQIMEILKKNICF